ncbi:MAG: hypothetical protein GC193_01185 [Cryomorphaceae bacterium]|nr:hypothetical protein [Cryomorphaceae bacterium]
MRKILFPALATIFIIAASAFTLNQGIEIGQKAPSSDYKMMGVDGKAQTLEGLKKENGLLVIFSCNTCPFVVGREGASAG